MADLFTLLLVALIIGMVAFWSIRNGIGPTPTTPKVKDVLLTHLPQVVDGLVIDAGSGFGTMALTLARHYPNCRVVGYESSPVPYLLSKLLVYLIGPNNLTIRYTNFWKEPFGDAALVFCYLYPKAMERFGDKCLRELSHGAWVVSNTFAIPKWPQTACYTVNDLYRTTIFFYLR